MLLKTVKVVDPSCLIIIHWLLRSVHGQLVPDHQRFLQQVTGCKAFTLRCRCPQGNVFAEHEPKILEKVAAAQL